MKHKHRQAEKGSVLFYILIAVVLFAALSYSVGTMMRGGGENQVGQERAKILAAEVLNYGRAIRSAVQDMRISNGCAATDIRFITSALTGYGTSVRSACDVFDTAGGGITYIAPNSEVTSESWYITGGTVVSGIGTECTNSGCTELLLVLAGLPISICNEINSSLNIDDSVAANVEDNISAAAKFTGSYAYDTSYVGDTTAVNLVGKNAACMISLGSPSSAGTGVFYQVLIAR